MSGTNERTVPIAKLICSIFWRSTTILRPSERAKWMKRHMINSVFRIFGMEISQYTNQSLRLRPWNQQSLSLRCPDCDRHKRCRCGVPLARSRTTRPAPTLRWRCLTEGCPATFPQQLKLCFFEKSLVSVISRAGTIPTNALAWYLYSFGLSVRRAQ